MSWFALVVAAVFLLMEGLAVTLVVFSAVGLDRQRLIMGLSSMFIILVQFLISTNPLSALVPVSTRFLICYACLLSGVVAPATFVLYARGVRRR